MTKRIWAVLLCMAMIFSMIPLTAIAAADNTKGVGNQNFAEKAAVIAASSDREGTENAFDADAHKTKLNLEVNKSKIAFAGHEWWVIGDSKSGVYPQKDCITLLAANYDFGKTTFRSGQDSDAEGYTKYSENKSYYANNPEGMENWTTPNEYAGSTLQQKMVTLANEIPGKEQAVISERSLTGGGTYLNPSTDGIAGQGINGQKLWALSQEEWNTINDTNVRKYDTWWWLRSPYSRYGDVPKVGVDSGKSMFNADANVNDAVRPALSLNLSSVLFTSVAAEGGKASATVGKGLVAAEAPSGTVKFTMKNNGQTLNVNATTAQSKQTGTTLSFTYADATIGDKQYISCILTEDSGAVKYYGKLADSSVNASGNLSIPLDGVEDGTYTLKIFSEEANDHLHTDFCSEPVTMTVAVSNGKGTVSEFGGTLLHEHNWSEPVWNWSENNTATVKFVCKNDEKHTETPEVTMSHKTTEPTCTTAGETVYTATVTFNGKTYTDSKTVVIPETGHKSGTLVKGQAAAQDKDGWKDYYKCEDCGRFFEDAACTKEIKDLEAWRTGAGKIDKLDCKVVDGTNGNRTKNPDVPKTGDAENVALWVLLSLLSFGGASALLLKNKKRKSGVR